MTEFRFIQAAGVLVAAALFAVSPLPASASGMATSTAAAASNAGTSGAGRSQPSASSRRATPNAGDRQICIRETLTGSRLTRKICKTAREWEAEGGLIEER